MMELFDKRVQDQKGVHINDNEYQKKEYGSIFSSVYDVHYNNGIRNEKTLKYRKMNEDRFKQQQQPPPRKKTPPKQQQQIQQQPQPQPQPQYDQSAAQMRQLQQQLSQFQQMYQAQLQAQKMREMSEQERLRMVDLEYERQKQIQLDLERQVQHEKEAIEYLQRLIELQNQKQVVQEPVVEEEVPDPLQEELERKQQELKMLKEKLHREKLQMTGNSDMYKKMMTELNSSLAVNELAQKKDFRQRNGRKNKTNSFNLGFKQDSYLPQQRPRVKFNQKKRIRFSQ
ncbi:hypothetical protein PPERSA_11743 [Pseudocohnilembus persalinus]|uniref:Uncharacterized protein n=1 Tax=Pseudocohnilembus persalinus TaxID=266149 RepID=A0A0V0QGP9_PSEPJ|nr:hypothetical protein PPERSA_11743 [Pseudocohnilembus persalinus]|eukprot:KRX01296.1 hypothetical protein PPERSA_11743 [Pseudocohnilembus persalinus]